MFQDSIAEYAFILHPAISFLPECNAHAETSQTSLKMPSQEKKMFPYSLNSFAIKIEQNCFYQQSKKIRQT